MRISDWSSDVCSSDLGALRDSRTASRTPHYGPLGTFTGFDIARMDASPIDHIFISDDVTVLRHATLTDQNGGKLPSDNYPEVAELCIGEGCWRSEESRVGKEWVSPDRSRWAQGH